VNYLYLYGIDDLSTNDYYEAMKKCCCCKIEKDLFEFSNSQLLKNSSKCRACVSAYNREYRKNQDKEAVAAYQKQYREDNKEELAEKRKEYYQDNKPEINARNKQYYQDNKEAMDEYYKNYRETNKEELAEKRKEYYQENRDEILEEKKIYQQENKEVIAEKKKIYYQDNKDYFREYARTHQKERLQNDPEYKIHRNISRLVNFGLKANGASKAGESVEPNLPASFQEMKCHLEDRFPATYNLTRDGKVWMNWNNWGRYDPKTWDDNDPSTWTWQIDHIIPRSDLPYTSMQDENFKKCWALENLRPLSAKQNWLDGVRRTRHKKETK
jgi:hypothetical protein